MIALLFICFIAAKGGYCVTDEYDVDRYSDNSTEFIWQRPLEWDFTKVEVVVLHIQNGDELHITYMLDSVKNVKVCIDSCIIEFDSNMIEGKQVKFDFVSRHEHNIEIYVKNTFCVKGISVTEIIVISVIGGFIVLSAVMLACCGTKNDEESVSLTSSG